MDEAGKHLKQLDNLARKLARAAEQLMYLSRLFYQRGWMLGTSGNLSIALLEQPLIFAITASGIDKGQVRPEDIVMVDETGAPLEEDSPKPSAESILHARLYKKLNCGCILHVHSIYSALIAERYADDGEVVFSKLEMIKGLDIWDPDAVCRVPVVENYPDIRKLAEVAAERANPQVPGLLIANHGLYAWGKTSFEAQRHVEIFEYIFNYLFLRAFMSR